MSRATEDALGNLHGLVARVLAEKLEDTETCSAQDIAQAIKFLKDNNIEATKDNPALNRLANATVHPFPVMDSEEDELYG